MPMPDHIDWEERSNYWELLYLRATEGARAANRGLQRLRCGYDRVLVDLQVAEARIGRLERENSELEKKVERLSLRVIKEWGRR